MVFNLPSKSLFALKVIGPCKNICRTASKSVQRKLSAAYTIVTDRDRQTDNAREKCSKAILPDSHQGKATVKITIAHVTHNHSQYINK